MWSINALITLSLIYFIYFKMTEPLGDRLKTLGCQIDQCLEEIAIAKKVSKARSGILNLAIANMKVN